MRAINNVIEKENYPLPDINQSLESLGGNLYYSSLDLTQSFMQVPIHKADRHKMSFVTPSGQYQLKRMSFGGKNNPSLFARLMTSVLHGYCYKICLLYLDDIIVMGKTYEENIARLDLILTRLQAANLKIKPAKCNLFQKELNFLGHHISSSGISTSKSKVEKIVSWATPMSPEHVKSFLGLAAYYRRFIKGFAEIAAPLYKMTTVNKQDFMWNSECEFAFNHLKTKLTEAPILTYPDFSDQANEYILAVDASNYSIGAVLSQVQQGMEKVICYGSRALSKTERNYCVTRKEMLALVYFLEEYRCFLLGKHFTVKTDNIALKWLRNARKKIYTGQMVYSLGRL
jgi:hypothetical protein